MSSRETNILKDREQLLRDMKTHGIAMVHTDGTRIDPQSVLDNQGEEELRLEQREQAESERLREIHLGDPAYDNLHSPAAIRRQEERDREDDRWAY